MPGKIDIIVDTREKKPYEIRSKYIGESISQKLDTGDYSVVGLEDYVTIDRKMSVNELATNITTDRFARELQRMTEIEHSFLLLEFSVDDVIQYPYTSNVPKRLWSKIRVKGAYLLKKIMEIPTKYGVHLLFAGDRDNAEILAAHILKNAYEQKNGPL